MPVGRIGAEGREPGLKGITICREGPSRGRVIDSGMKKSETTATEFARREI
jgi:hypothetical protein